MKRIVAVAMMVSVMFGAIGSVVAADPQTLTGDFVWNNDNLEGNVEAVFTETGAGKYDVAFHFNWEGKPHTWSGTAEGSLTKGKLEGRVETDDPERKSTFTFAGKFKKGTFKGTHGTTGRDGRPRETGTLTLR